MVKRFCHAIHAACNYYSRQLPLLPYRQTAGHSYTVYKTEPPANGYDMKPY